MAYISGTRTKVVEVVLDRLAHHCDADEVQRRHPFLSLAQIHATLAYYYDHQAEMDDRPMTSFATWSGFDRSKASHPFASDEDIALTLNRIGIRTGTGLTYGSRPKSRRAGVTTSWPTWRASPRSASWLPRWLMN